MPSKVFCGHSNLRWTKKPMHWCVSPASTPNSEPSTWTTFYIFLRTGFLSWHPRISAVGIQCKRFWIEKQNSRNLWAPQAERVKFHWHPHPAEDRDLSVPHSAQAWFFFIMCAHPSLRGIKFFYPNNTKFGQTVINENGVSHVWLWTPSQGPEDSAFVVWSKISWSWVGHFSFK